MIVSNEIEAISKKMAENFEEINLKYIKKMSNHIGKIGRLDADDLHRLEQFAIMSSNADEINKLIAKQCKITEAQLMEIYQRSGIEQYERLSIFYKAKGIAQIPFEENARMQAYVKSINNLTVGAFENISRTTSVDKVYRDAVDKGIYAVSNGVEDYQTAVRSAVKNAVANGTKTKYASGLKRRLDSAVRMNILDGVRQVNNGIRMIAGEEFGADGVELSAHGLCAEDHLPYQGRQFSNEKFEIINSNLERPIGELNCHHAIYPIVLGVSEPAHSREELQQMKDYSKKTFDFGDKTLTRYQASQKMREIETKIRYQEEYRLAADGYGDDALKIKCDDNIRDLKKAYSEIAQKTELSERFNRTRIASKSKKYQGAVMDEYSLQKLKKMV